MATENKANQRDPWLGIFCPAQACLTEEEQVKIPSSRTTLSQRPSAWLGIFCPEDRCAVDTPTHIV